MKRIYLIIIFGLLIANYSFGQSAREYYNMALEEVKKDNHVKAIDYFTLAISKQPNNDVAVYGRACSKMHIGDTEGAIFDFDMAIELNPNNYFAYHNLGVIEYNANNLDAALGYFKISLKIDPTNTFAQFSIAQINYEKQEIDEAIKYFEATLRNDKTLKLLKHEQKIYCRTYYASALSMTKRFDEALNQINISLELDSKNYEAHYIKGSILYEQKKYSDAILSYDTALILNKDFGYGYFARGIAKRALGDKIGATQDFEIAKSYGFIAEK